MYNFSLLCYNSRKYYCEVRSMERIIDITGEIHTGMWSYGFFTSQGVTSASSYVINEDLLNELMNVKSVYINVPVYLLDVPEALLLQ